jgi:lipopolysaccharide transport system ATP-binding protein
MSTVISVEKLGKKYLIKHQSDQQPYISLRDVVCDGVRNLGRQLIGGSRETGISRAQEEFWALKDVSFEVRQGDRIGIIGRNGAGKSTLLKILSRITEPSAGKVRIKGRVASLLEVGTGFHPELTGRENIFLNGAILGMSRTEIKKKFDEIVAFAEIEKFLDTPVKRYSSGMYVRLAFAVAAHLEPEILVVDEVLAVGDAQFQKKCLDKMEDVSAKEGRTVLFVSHNLFSIVQLCDLCIFLKNGQIASFGNSAEVVKAYYSLGIKENAEYVSDKSRPDQKVELLLVRIKSDTGSLATTIDAGSSCSIEIEFRLNSKIDEMRLVVRVATLNGVTVFASSDTDAAGTDISPREKGLYVSTCTIQPQFFNEGSYCISVSADDPFKEVFFKHDDLLVFSVDQVTSTFRKYPESWPGVIRPMLVWRTEKNGAS